MADKEYDNTNKGALFKNDRRSNERQPQYKGEVNVEGVEYWLSAWLNESRSGQKYFSLSLTKKDAAVGRPMPIVEADEDDVPF